MEFPSSIHSPRLAGSAGLIMRYEARTSTEQPAIVLVAPLGNYGAVSLEAAHKALITLRQDELPFPGCPSLIDYQESFDGGALLALGLRGAPLALAWPDEAVETDVLDLAIQHTKLLEALHKAGFSGLQPGFEDLRWDSTHKSLLILGWEWVRENEESQHEDLRAAAALWVELLAGAAPPVFPPLTSETAWPAWQRVSLGTRALLSSILFDVLQATATAKKVHEQLESMLRNWNRPVDELLSEGLDLLAREKLQGAQVLFDLAARRDPASIGAYRFQITRETATARFNRLINDVRIGSYYPTETKLLQLAEGSGITTQERLRAWRWWTVTDTLWRLSPAQTSDASDGQEKLAAALLETLDSIDRGRLKAALQQLQRALAEWGEDQPTGRLGLLEVDLRVSLRMEDAVNRLLEDPPSSVDLFEQAVSDMVVLPAGYRAMLESQIGDPAVGLWQARQKIDRADLVRRTVNEARAAFKAKKFAVAQDKWNAVLRLMDRQDPKRSQYHREIKRVQLRSNAVAAGVAANLKHMDQGAARLALEALSALRAASARDCWGLAQEKRWQEMVMSYLERDPVGPAGGWLVAYWSKEPDVQRCLQEVAPKAMATWGAKYAEIRDVEPPRTPQRIGEHMRCLDTFLASLASARRWMEFSGSEEEFNNLYQTASWYRDELRGLAAAQLRLRTQYQAALDAGVPPFAILAEAEQLGVELFDVADLSNGTIQSWYSNLATHQTQLTARLMLAAIESAWRANDRDLALRIGNMILGEPSVSENVRLYVEAVGAVIEKGYALPSEFIADISPDESIRLKHIELIDIPSANAPIVLNESIQDSLNEIMKAFQEMSESLGRIHNAVVESENADTAERYLEVQCAALDHQDPIRATCKEICRLASVDEFVKAQDLLTEAKKNARRGARKKCIEQCERHLEGIRTKRASALLSQLADIIGGQTSDSPQETARIAKKALEVLRPLMEDGDYYSDLEARCKDVLVF